MRQFLVGLDAKTRNYLEKLIQIPFRIPALGETETRIYVTLLLIGAQLGETDGGYAKLIATARGRLTRPWRSAPLDFAAIKATLGDKAAEAENAQILSDQIGPILAAGAKGNPRQIKRFLNSLLLRQRTAEARGFGDDVKLPVLAKLMLAERFLSRLFDQIAAASAAHPEGYCDELAILEAASKDMKATPSPATGAKTSGRHKVIDADKDISRAEGAANPGESSLLAEWLSSQAIRAWAQAQPALADVDLRPYFFVAKDRKDYFGPLSALGHLAAVVEKLLGPKLSVQKLDGELRQLAPPEAVQVFDSVRGRIISGDTFDTLPPGIDGLTILVRAHPVLQNNLIDFLESLPSDRCGAWPVSGWDAVITEQGVATRLMRLLERWSISARSTPLKTAATAALKLPRRRA